MQDNTVKNYMYSSMILAVVFSAIIYLVCVGLTGLDQWACRITGVLAGFFALWGYSGWYLRKLCRQVDHAGDVFEEILADSSREEKLRRSEEEWNRRLSHSREEGVIGRLESRLLESVQILGQREVSHMEEQRYLKEMMTDISHQIKTPLASLQVFMDIFEKEFHDRKMLEMVDQARKQTDRILRLVRGLLKLTQLESGMLPVQKTNQDLGMMLRECVQMVVAGFPEKKLCVSFRGREGCMVMCEKEWLCEAFQNIIKNCCEYSREGGSILIAWNQTRLADTVRITDHGAGIPQEELPRIFNRFYQVHGTQEQRSNQDGIGIGLALARKIIERQGGTVVAYSSTVPPSYTRFEIVLIRDTQDPDAVLGNF